MALTRQVGRGGRSASVKPSAQVVRAPAGGGSAAVAGRRRAELGSVSSTTICTWRARPSPGPGASAVCSVAQCGMRFRRALRRGRERGRTRAPPPVGYERATRRRAGPGSRPYHLNGFTYCWLAARPPERGPRRGRGGSARVVGRGAVTLATSCASYPMFGIPSGQRASPSSRRVAEHIAACATGDPRRRLRLVELDGRRPLRSPQHAAQMPTRPRSINGTLPLTGTVGASPGRRAAR